MMDYQDKTGGFGQDESMGPVSEPRQQTPVYVNTGGKKKSGWRVFWGIFLGLSVLANIVFFLMIIGLMAVIVTGKTDIITEKVLVHGPRAKKIAVIRVQGIIDSAMARDIIEQIEYAQNDHRVKAIIINVDSPGGTVSGSDQIHNAIVKYRNDYEKPVVGFMQNLAASGGYYISVATDEIVAEPTTITGSVGVIMGYLVLQDLLEGKLGIEPVVVKSGRRKDWPSSFRKPTEEELLYYREKVIDPAFNRFKQIVADGRKELSMEDVTRLADGSIFPAEEALEEKMVDELGYFNDAVTKAKELANLYDAQVVEYRRPFSFASIFGAETNAIFKLDKNKLYELSTPQVMYLWSIH